MFYKLPAPQNTRERFVHNAFFEMHEKGFGRMSLASLCKKSRITKGSFFHHFKSKKEVALAVIQEVLVPLGVINWARPLQANPNPIQGLLQIIVNHQQNVSDKDVRRGCAFQNLAQELSPLDQDFEKALRQVFENWNKVIAKSLRAGQKNGFVRADVDSSIAARQVLTQFFGAVVLARTFQSKKDFVQVMDQLADFVRALSLKKIDKTTMIIDKKGN